ncbi:MAG: C40 family peptidase [Flavobacteriaceae bacterium]
MTKSADELDHRLNAFRPDLADSRLEGVVEAARFVEGVPRRVVAPVTRLKRWPRRDAPTDTELLFGETVWQFEDNGEGWAWVQAEFDGYVGYVETDGLASADIAPTHRVRAQRSFRYPAPDMKQPPGDALSMGSLVTVSGHASTRGTDYALLADGTAMVACHLEPVATVAGDYVAVAETLLHAPYLWGGRSGFGIDCSGLVQLSMAMAGTAVPRDTDMQEKGIGEAISGNGRQTGLQRGDLVFWKGHVAILTDASTIIHANGHSMTVAAEPLDGAVERIARLYGSPTSVRRPRPAQRISKR